MKSELPPCDRELLRQSLDDSLSELQEEELAGHLSRCEACRRDLERLAAEQSEWLRVTEVLKQEAQSSRSDTAEGSKAGFPVLGRHGGDSELAPHDGRVVSASDFAVDFLDPSRTPETLGRLDDIDIHEVIGRGGMGIVLRGFQRELNRPVAVKVLAPHLATSGAARKRFAREAQAAAVIVHPNVMPILTVHSSGKLPYLVMPYVACESLQHRLDRGGSLATVDVLRIAVQVAGGLAAAHAQGLVHRDIKPANVLLEKGVDRAMLTDFGLARAVDDATLTRTGVIAGTPQFMSPEQARGEPVDARSDLFSLGSVLYAMGAGRPPFRAETSYGILRRITDTEPRPIRDVNPEIPDWLAAVIGKLHAKDAAKRFQAAGEVARLLEGCLAHLQQPTVVRLPQSVQSLVPRSFPTAREGRSAFSGWLGRLGGVRRPRTVLAGGIVVGVLAVAAMVGIKVWDRSENGDSRTSDTSAPAAGAAPAQPESAAAPESDDAAWRDGAAEEILDLDHGIERLEAEAARLWDDEPPSSVSQNGETQFDP